MNYLLYLAVVACNVSASVFTKLNSKRGGNSTLFNFFRALVPFLAFGAAALAFGGKITARTALFGAAYGACLAGSTVCGYFALACGPMGITSAIATFSLVPVTVFCVIFRGEPLTAIKAAGIIFALVSLVVMNAEKPRADFNKRKWLTLALSTLSLNAACQIIIVVAGGDGGGITFTACAQIVPFLAFGTAFLISIIKRRAACASETSDELPSADTSDTLNDAARPPEKPELQSAEVFAAIDKEARLSEEPEGLPTVGTKANAGKAAVFGAVAGVTTASSAFVTFLLAASSQGSVLFPLVSVINLIGVFLVGTFLFKEKPTPKRIIAIALAIAAIALLKFSA